MPSERPANKRRSDPPVNANDRPAGKRSRVSRACDQCRVAREKCDGVQPTCHTCSASSRACTYTTNPKKRGIQPGYIRTLELALTWLFNTIPNTEISLNRKLAQEGAACVLLGKDTNDANKLHKSWRRSGFSRDVDKLLSGGDLLRLDDRSPESDEDENEPDYPAHMDTNFSAPHNHQANPVSISRLPLKRKQSFGQLKALPTNRWRLFDIYFAHTHCWFPLSEKHDLLKTSYSYPDQGLDLTPEMAASGDHAELWSVLAFASLHEALGAVAPHTETPFTPELYGIARSLIPHEVGNFEIGHVKALLNLALINISHSIPEAGWLLVGQAARILVGIQQAEPHRTSPRLKHVLAGCFLLDTILSIQLRRRPYLHLSEARHFGKIDQDGIEEWQPWVGCLDSGSRYYSTRRAPVMSLSTLNYMIEIADILALANLTEDSNSSSQEALRRIELWKASLPLEFAYIRDESDEIPSTPPAILLQLVHRCASLSLFSTPQSALRITELLEKSRDVLGLISLPPLVQNLLEIAARSRSFETLDQGSRIRFAIIRTEYTQAWSQGWDSSPTGLYQAPLAEPQGRSEPASARYFDSPRAQMPTPESVQIHVSQPPAFQGHAPTGASSLQRSSSTLLDDLLPDMGPTAGSHQPHSLSVSSGQPHLQGLDITHFDGSFPAPILDPRNPVLSTDLESFFDELASLDGAERIDNQPQFMQNLGFAPDANIADLGFSQLNSLLPPYDFTNSNDQNPLDQAHLFHGS
ncbi:hypothetical protein BCR34DRAFT_350994 [Clohesyomyces aquaticus]|uniref:Zn(2)-C6 fungal-type domain-containing protein n=1 Tax=Clohesyomyces aquaticus TaxID=1231657 RepID=A0A1Y1ZJJ5_9PLEO|nr:hypothetical protein BCR34DRAFT_350994 [Clohesyomyces aquaticus]